MIGTKLSNRYEILKEVGRGGMGIVYLARDPVLDRQVAVKVVTPSHLSADSIERFNREARVVAKMDHPSIVVVYDLGEHQGSLFFVMPFLHGATLRSHLDNRSLRLGEVVEIGIQLADALEYSHNLGVIHRDIKPENILVEPEGVRVRVTDFGLARVSTENRLTQSGTLVGTVAYLSPEQFTAKEVDGRSDIYSLGTVLYECLVGQAPFSGEFHSVLYRIAHEIPPSPRSIVEWIPEELDSVVMKCLEKEPDRRFSRAKELAEALSHLRAKLHEGDGGRKMLSSVTDVIRIPVERTGATVFIGRQKELGELQRRLNAAIAGECQFVLIAGEAGIGKSRLLDELEKLAKMRKIPVLHGRFVEMDQSFPYQGFCEVILEYFRSLRKTSAPADFSDLAPDLISLFPVLAEIEEFRPSTSMSRPISGDTGKKVDDRTAVFDLLARVLARVASGKPLVIFLEDLHAGEISVDALQYVVRRLTPTPTLIVATYRISEVGKRHPIIRMLDSFQRDRRYAFLRLEPFLPSDHRSFVESIIGSSDVDQGFADQIYEATEGNPLFTQEMVRSLIDSGRLTKTDTGSWNVDTAEGVSAESLPATIQQAVERRIERLPKNMRDILAVASVLGRNFEVREVALLLGKKQKIESALERLIQDGFIQEERESRGERLSFVSGVVRDVLYSELSRSRRKSLHRKYAEEMEKRNAGRLERVYPHLVRHYLHGDVPEKAVEYGLKLARKSLDAFSPEDAVRAARTVLQALGTDADHSLLQAEARTLLGMACRMSGNPDVALEEFQQATVIYEQVRDPVQALSVVLMGAETAWESRKIEETRHWVERGLALTHAVEDPGALIRFLSLAATIANLRGDYEKAKEYLRRVEELAPSVESREEIPQGGRLVVAVSNAIHATHPASMKLDEEAEVFANVFETLLSTDEQGNLLPFLCEHWEVLDQGKSFVFTLRNDVRLHNGKNLTAEDVKQSFELSIRESQITVPPAFTAILGVKATINGSAETVSGISVLDKYKFRIDVFEPLPIYPGLLTDHRTAITARVEGSNYSWVGSGPFRVQSHSPDRVVLERNADYWRGTSTVLDAVEFRASLRAPEMAAGFRSGAYDIVRDVLPEDLDRLLHDRFLHAGFVEAPKKNIHFLLFNMSSSTAHFPMFRWALCGAVRTQDLVRGTLGRLALPAEGLLPPGILGHDPGRRRNPLPIERVQELLESCRFSLPLRLKASVHPVLHDRYAALTQALFKTWSSLGIEVDIVTPNMASFQERVNNNEGIDLMITRWIADYDDPDNFTHGLFHSQSGRYRNYYASKDLDRLMEEARAESRTSTRERLYRKIESLLLETAFVLPLFHDIDYRIFNPNVRRLTLTSSPPYVNYAEAGKIETAVGGTVRTTGGGVIHVPISGEIRSLDPTLASMAVQSEVIPTVFENLTREREGARIVPWLASEFHAEEGGRKYRFHLREDVKFHDGRRLTARDVRYSFERLLLNKESTVNWILSPIRGAQALLDGTQRELEGFRILSATEFTIDLERPVSFFPALLAYTPAAIVPEATHRVEGTWRQGIVGTGPFRVVQFEPGRRLELQANPHYWQPGTPKCDGLVFTFAVTPPEILAGFRSGRFSVAWDLFPADVETLRRETEQTSRYRETPRLSTYYVVFNIHEGPLRDEKLRHLLAEAIDPAGIVRRNLGRLAIPAHSLIPPGLLGYEADRGTSSRSGPKKISGKALVLDGMRNPAYDERYANVANEVHNAFREVGFEVRVIESKFENYNRALGTAPVDFAIERWIADYPDADNFIHGLLHSEKGLVGRFCGGPEIDRLIERGRMETRSQIRHEIYREIEEIVKHRAMLAPLFHEQSYCFARPEVENLEVTFGLPHVCYEKLSTSQ